MVVVRRRNRAAGRQQSQRIGLQRLAGRAQAPSIRARACPACTAASAASRATSPAVDAPELVRPAATSSASRFLRSTGQRSLQRVGRRGAIAALALLVEIHRRGVQAERHRRRLGRPRRVAVVLARRDRRIRTRRPPHTSHRKSGSSSAASVCASAISAAGEGSAKRSSTLAALILSRLPEAASTCSDVSLSARTVPALNCRRPRKRHAWIMARGLQDGGRARREKGPGLYPGDGAKPRPPGHCAGPADYFSMRLTANPLLGTTMEFRRLGETGLEVSLICLGTMMFGDRTDAATAQRIVASAFDAGSELHRHRRRVRQRSVGKDRRSRRSRPAGAAGFSRPRSAT